ncbi:molybdate ABC transporter substrate-binding protein [Hufsiella ginkgonis]|uniref:Molybdate ABC transporter substrate-binding protein n=1 Tax=Hufsiella ginkgonis TaxID=2695274 RepID=A0A7K1XVP9_9SPHI|nr:molybdate ABC transporter substrate-binding protein [Hufsiella ginkgonis]MXV15075.1 molybdate ABC transporter substrate-binding protein [Hufsiella ginkgonis]
MKKLTVLLICLLTLPCFAQPLRIAVAANAQFVIKILQADFKKKTGIETEAIVGSSGKLAAQIRNGAPYDLFLSADMEFPTALFKEGFGVTRPVEYASGSLILCGAGTVDLRDWQAYLLDPRVKNIAIANPVLAPYGKAAEQALRNYQLWDKVSAKIVPGESISQVNTYITTGSVPIGFTTESLIYEYTDKTKLTWIRIDPKVYDRISQGMIVLSHSRKRNYTRAIRFLKYLSSTSAKQILKKNGYQVP